MHAHIIGSCIAIAISIIIGCQTNDPPTSSKYSDSHKSCTSSICDIELLVNTTCPSDMAEIEGDYCPSVEQECLKLDMTVHNANGYVKCDKFKAPSKCLSATTYHKHFCMDMYEWPNKKDAIPEVMVSWNQMKTNCAAQGKRLCADKEWTLACEGPDMLPYPYGYERDATACNIDHDQRADFDATKAMTPAIVAHLDQRVASGSMERCISPFGVHDMTGNVDESIVNSGGKPYESGEMGGHWVKGARNRCRPKTIAHNESFQYYEIGGRCCKDIE